MGDVVYKSLGIVGGSVTASGGINQDGDFKRDAEVGRLVAAIAKHQLFAGLPWASIPGLVPAFRIEEFQDEEIGCHCPDAFHDGFLVLEGRVALTHRSRGLEQVLALEGFGAVFNLDGLLGLKESHRSARALGRANLLVMDTQLLGQNFDRDPGTGYRIIKTLAKLLVVQHDKELEHWVT